ncbi:MAG: hypothetical protein QHC67_13420 [Sphingobium sp.]|uniref:DUF6771 family protein n=1 Tax=Sphingobium sp. TaxID=1912891 RepID=UPI0029B46279|nr:DUF6771 family protein [Sphingobium sp.]MDX3910800.1 hypothetical protein [Sphingobium sp.]
MTGTAIAAGATVMDQPDLTAIVTAVLAKAPQWIRHDLASTDATLRVRAEESLAAMIAAALGADQGATG